MTSPVFITSASLISSRNYGDILGIHWDIYVYIYINMYMYVFTMNEHMYINIRYYTNNIQYVCVYIYVIMYIRVGNIINTMRTLTYSTCHPSAGWLISIAFRIPCSTKVCCVMALPVTLIKSPVFSHQHIVQLTP